MKGLKDMKSLCLVCPTSLGIGVTFHYWVLSVPKHVFPLTCAFGQLRLVKQPWTWKECRWKCPLSTVVPTTLADDHQVFPLISQHVH